MLEVIDIKKYYNTREKPIEVLKGISFTVKQGEMVGILGPSGVGKSTLLHIIGTIERPTSGEISINGFYPFKLDDRKLARFRNSHIGFVFQFHYLLPEFNALENTMMPALIYGINKKKAQEMAESILSEVGLSHRLSHKPAELSGGELQRVAVARALVLSPPLLLADEPTGNLDTSTGETIHKLLVELNQKKGITMLIVTHNPDLAKITHRQIHVKDGRIVSPFFSME
ncbi:MAG: lipoprotein-releasing system ATP-binding protein LolD [Deltaproteobacteria bacterium]|nr:ABC transporter ATP-binding protein [Deltaproteobacteria bacterium]RLA88635.1 MAG: lipoprotein-releasing system ATP-binding protein LolD [Deltaproteobacteria bacterium]